VAKSVTIKFNKERESKNMVRFEEDGEEHGNIKLYLGKDTVKKLGNPEAIEVEVRSG
jgi:hypothetical protein